MNEVLSRTPCAAAADALSKICRFHSSVIWIVCFSKSVFKILLHPAFGFKSGPYPPRVSQLTQVCEGARKCGALVSFFLIVCVACHTTGTAEWKCRHVIGVNTLLCT